MTWLALLLIGGMATAWALSRSNDQSLDVYKPQRQLLVVELALAGDAPSPASNWAAECLTEELGLRVQVRERPLLISKKSFHPDRGQGNAVELVEMLANMVTPDCAVLGLIEYDLHSPLRRDLPFAMGAKKGIAGLISTYRMEDKRHADNTRMRLRKMLVRYGAEVACDARRDDDPRSVLYESLHRPEQLDIMIWPDEPTPAD